MKKHNRKTPRDSNPDVFTLMVLFALIPLFYVFCIFSETRTHTFFAEVFFAIFLCSYSSFSVCFTSFLCRHERIVKAFNEMLWKLSLIPTHNAFGEFSEHEHQRNVRKMCNECKMQEKHRKSRKKHFCCRSSEKNNIPFCFAEYKNN